MTETSAAVCLSAAEDPTTQHVGGPTPSVKIRLKDVPEMGYYAKDIPYPRGEICFKGPSILKGYFRDPEKTAEVLSSDGWLASGDVGVIRDDGSIQIVDRAKSIFKLSQGEYIAPTKLENIYG